jgi:glycosyltransferase involved in cell wall biosynthesis
MHIVQLLPELNQGGVERYVVELSRELIRLGHQCTVISAGGQLADQIMQDGGEHITLDLCSKNPLTFFRRARALRSLISEIRPSVIHAHSRVPAWLFSFANRSLRIPFVTTVHGFNHVSRYSRIMTTGDRVIAVSKSVQDYIHTHYATSPEKISVIPCGVNAREFDPEHLDRRWIHQFKDQFNLHGKAVITSIGRISRVKDYETFIRAIALCAKETPDICGLIVGTPRPNHQGYQRRLELLTRKLQIEDRIVFAGYQTRLPEIYDLSSAVISSSKEPETFGLTLIESMAMNTPVIATRHGGPLDIITEEQTGRFFAPADAEDLAAQITATLSTPRRELRTETIRRFSAETTTTRTLAVYETLLRTLHVVQLVPELNQGGVERGVVEFNRELVKRGHISTVISAGGKMAAQIEADGGQLIELDVCSKNPFTVPLRVRALRRLLSDLWPPISVIHARSRVPAWLCFFADKKLKIPFITTVHGFNSVSRYSEIMTKGDAVICVSNPVKRYIQENYGTPEDKITVIHRGIDPEEFNPEKLDQEWINSFKVKYDLSDKYIVTTVGRITELKDYEAFIRAIAACAQTIPNIKGVIVGGVRHDKQAYYERLQDLVKELHAENHIIFAGSHSQMSEIYELSDVLVSSSKQPESFGRTLIEAMAMNTPVIATRHGGALDIIEEGVNGLLFEPGNEMELAGAILSQNQIQRDGLREYVLKNFSLDRMTDDELAVYRELLQKD